MERHRMPFLELTKAKIKEYSYSVHKGNKIIGTLELRVQREVSTK
jgi:hypothetical protein